MKAQDTDKLKSLFHKVAGKESLNDEEQRLLASLLDGEEWREVYDNLSNGEYVCGRFDDMKRYPKKEAFMKFSRRVYPSIRRRRFIRGLSVAASVLLILGVVLFMYVGQDETPVPAVVSNVIPAGTSKASLVLATGEVIDIHGETGSIEIGDSTQLLNRDGELVYDGMEKAGAGLYNELIVPRGGEYAIVLSDGTKVKLNAGSRLRYPVKFQPGERRVEVTGEAFFEVVKNDKAPFVVMCGDVRMRVLGTSFNVNGYKGETSIITTLATGRLEVNSGREKVVLLPGVQSRVDIQSGRIDTLKVDVGAYTAWLDNKFTFKDETLGSVMKSLARWYDVEFVPEGIEPEEYQLTGKIPRHGSLQEVTSLLEKIADVRFVIEGKRVIVRSK